MSERYYIATPISPNNFAGTKAREDIESLAESRGMQRFAFCGNTTANRNPVARIHLIWQGLINWIRLERVISPRALVLFQYPHYPLKSARLARIMLRRIQRKKHVRFVALVHDLNSARNMFGEAAVYSDRHFLPQFDAIICHNDRMRDFLIRSGCEAGKLVSLGVFDYLTDGIIPSGIVSFSPSVNIAGNLSREKSGYLYQLLDSGFDYRLFLYGAGFSCAADHPLVSDEGLVAPWLLPTKLKGAFGLVWDGERADSCSGDFGAYLAINNPHKLSLYLAAGIPVICWSGAALTGYIEQNGLGFCVGALGEILERFRCMEEQDYQTMRSNAAQEGARIRSGYYFDRAIREVEEICLSNERNTSFCWRN